MAQVLIAMMDRLPVLFRVRNPGVAGLLGFCFGGIGLAIYFRSLVDLIIPVLLAILFAILFKNLAAAGWLAGAVVAGLYGISRAVSSNRRLGAG